jgi:hypothetical protein
MATLQIRNWTEEGDICTVVCECGGLAAMEPDGSASLTTGRERPLPYTTAKCQKCGLRWRLESVNARYEAECSVEGAR